MLYLLFDSAVCILRVTKGTGRAVRGSDHGVSNSFFLFFKTPRPPLESNQPPIQWVPVFFQESDAAEE